MPLNKESFLIALNNSSIPYATSNLLVALSGGVDSVVLCELLLANEISFAVAHVNYGLRGIESSDDEQFVRTLSEKMSVRCFVLDASDEMAQFENHTGIQERAREIRYVWFNRVYEENGFNFILTAHHRDDQVETVFHQFVRGGGLSSLQGMSEMNGRIVRPLLGFSRNEILEYAHNINLQWREDSSNKKIDYTRNKIRHEVLPLLRQINPGLDNVLLDRSKLMRQTKLFLDEKLNDELHQCFIKSKVENAILCSDVAGSNYPDLLIWQWLEPYGFSSGQVAEVKKLLHAQKGSKVISSNFTIWRSDEALLVSSNQNESEIDLFIDSLPFITTTGFRIVESNTKEVDFNLAPNTQFLDASAIRFPLRLRRWRNGDVFNPLGMKGTQTMGDFLMRQNLSPELKRKVLVLESMGDIISVPGLRISDKHRITEDSVKIWAIHSV